MLVEYQYKTVDGRECGPYQCEDVDFRKFWKVARHDVRAAIVELMDGGTWIYFRRMNAGQWQQVRPPK